MWQNLWLSKMVSYLMAYSIESADGLASPRHPQTRMIQWFPGHIAKAERDLKEQLSAVDIIFEVKMCCCGWPGCSAAVRIPAPRLPRRRRRRRCATGAAQ